MSDPKLALAGIGKAYPKRTGPPPAIKAIKNDLIKVNFAQSKAEVALVRLLPKATAKSSQLVIKHSAPCVDMQSLEDETKMEMKKLKDPIRDLLRTRSTPSRLGMSKRTSNISFAASKVSSLMISPSRRSSLDRGKKLSNFSSSVSSEKSLGKGERKQEFIPHGFRYHSNGDERVSKTLSSSDTCIAAATLKAIKATNSFYELTKLRANIARLLPKGLQTNLGSHFCDSEIEHHESEGRCKASSRVSKATDSGIHKIRGANIARPMSSRDNNTMFKQTILRHINDMNQSKESMSRISVARMTSTHNNNRALAGRAPPKYTASSLSHAPNQTTESQGDLISAANSSFNMRYGVPVKLMAQRKHILDEKDFHELEEVHKNNAQIDMFLKEAKRAAQSRPRHAPSCETNCSEKLSSVVSGGTR